MNQRSVQPVESHNMDHETNERVVPPNGGTAEPQRRRTAGGPVKPGGAKGGPTDADHEPQDSENQSEGRHDPSNPHDTKPGGKHGEPSR